MLQHDMIFHLNFRQHFIIWTVLISLLPELKPCTILTADALSFTSRQQYNQNSISDLVTTWTTRTRNEQNEEANLADVTARSTAATEVVPVISRSVLFVPPQHISKEVTFLQRATNTRIQGREKLQSLCTYWESTFETMVSGSGDDDDDATYGRGVKFGLERVFTTTQTTVLVQWNVTWIPPTAIWLESLCSAIPGDGWEPLYRSYCHLSSQPSTFSYSAVFKLFQEAVATGQLRIPLACIQGTTTLEFDVHENSNSGRETNELAPMLRSITEDLNYAQDLERGVLRNRKCAMDLKLFLETGRCSFPDKIDDWDSIVNQLPWNSVQGMNPLEVDPQDDGEVAVPIFFGIVTVALVGFMALVAPELIGQSLFGGPTYIVQPSELDMLL